MEKQLKHSRQRDLIRSIMKGRTDHPTAAVIYDEVRKVDGNVSFATVYRNLNLLVENGELKRLTFDNEDHFDPFLNEHHHFVCDKCKKIVDIESSNEFLKLYKKFSNKFAGDIRSFDLTLHGTCKTCL